MLTHCHSSRRSETRFLISNHKRHSTGIVWSNNYIANNSTGSKHVMSTVHGQFPKWCVCCHLYCQVSASISIIGWCRIERKNLERDKSRKRFYWSDASAAAKRSWEKKVDECTKKEQVLEEHMIMLYSIIWSQCTELMRQRIQALPDYKRLTSMLTRCHFSRRSETRLLIFQSQKT